MAKDAFSPPAPETSGANIINHRVYYAEVDRMGWVYYGNYAAWLERGRTEWLREHGMTYRCMEDEGVFLPVRNYRMRYHHPAKYDDMVSIVTSVSRLRRMSLVFVTGVYDPDSQLLAEGEVELACVDGEGHPRALPEGLVADSSTEA